MKCPDCRAADSKVVESREAGEGDAIRRRRECLQCSRRFTTYERIERPNLAIVKKDGARELFDRSKLFAAIHRSVGKFLTSEVEIEQIVAEVENELHELGQTEVSSKVVGDMVLEQLAARNEVAYVRFASVYREFESLADFQAELDKIRARQAQKSAA